MAIHAYLSDAVVVARGKDLRYYYASPLSILYSTKCVFLSPDVLFKHWPYQENSLALSEGFYILKPVGH